MEPAAAEGPRTPLWSPTYRLLGYCVVVGVLGGVAAILFEYLVELAQRLLLGGVGHYVPPEPGVLPPEGAPAVPLPGWPERGSAVGMFLGFVLPDAGFSPPSFIIVGMAAVFAAAARTPISTLIMVAEMTGGYGLIVPAMLANTTAFVVQRTLTHGRRYPTLYEHQVPSREDSAAHRGCSSAAPSRCSKGARSSRPS